MTAHEPRIGIDLGGTKIEGIVMQPGSRISHRLRVATPRGDYAGQVRAIADLVAQLERDSGHSGLRVGIGHPGAVSPATGLIKNANSVCLNGRPLQADVEAMLDRPVRMANDADCLAASEQSDGAAAGASCVFAVILGTGVGGGICIGGRLLAGPNAIAGEWGHNPLPWPRPDWGEIPGPLHWDGRHGPIEAWLSGPGLAADHLRVTGAELAGEAVVDRALGGDTACAATLDRYEDRLARALATVINLIDPDVIVLGGGLSRIERLYRNVPALWPSWVFSDRVDTRLVPALHGDSSGVRGAARLWPDGGA
ncbi:fructokinase [Panacagrimonas perspica]|uniref:Fructokinase n=1 Tax=Panacagrimonas perspica TaxID=381431 RepID=A0A4S3JYY4_9GAMM|nr:ROK family protein [Panacagrimonas perspica]TDU31348.1 fructokinase [Panacagrimonas perspica]THD00766.1 fructokinase [Panacagrimonas perspica]